MKMSLKRKLALRGEAAAQAATARKVASLGRTTQVAHSTVTVGDDDVPVDDLLVGSADVAVTVEEHGEDLTILDDGASLDVDSWLDQQDQADADSDDAHAARMTAIETIPEVDAAQQSADDAAVAAAFATETALGNARYSQVDGGDIVPELPEDGPRVGAELVHIDETGHPYRVEVWNGTEWAFAQYLASELLVIGPDGTVQIKDGVVNAKSINAETFNGYSFRGAEFVQEASDDLVSIYPVTAGEIIETDWLGGRPDAWGAVATDTSVKETGTQSIKVARGTGSGSLSATWSNNGRVPKLSSSPRGVELRVRATAAATNVHVMTPAGTQQFANLAANTWTSLILDLPDDTSLDWVHVGVTVPASTTLYIDVVKILATGATGSYVMLGRTGAGLPGFFVVGADGNLLGDFTPLGARSFTADGSGYVQLADGTLTAASTDDDGTVLQWMQVTPDGLETPYGSAARRFVGTNTQYNAFVASGRARDGDLYFNTTDSREYLRKGGVWRRQRIEWTGVISITPTASGTATTGSIAFPSGLFPSAPVAGATVSSPAATAGVAAASVTATGCTASIIRSSTTTTDVTITAVLE